MHRYAYIALSLLLFLTVPQIRCEEEEESDVVVLTEDNFNDFLENNDFAVIEFYAPWCGHCKQFAPTYEKIATELQGEIPVAKVDADEHKTVGNKFDVQGFPTIIIWKNGEGHDYKGGRSQEALVKYAREVADPSWEPPKSQVAELTEENFDSYVEENEMVLVMFYAPWCGHCKKIKPAYEEAAQTLADMAAESGGPAPKLAKLDATVHGEVAKQFDVSGYPTLKVFRKGVATEYKGGRSANEIVEELMKQSGPPSTAFETVNSAKKLVSQTKGNKAVSVFYGCFAAENTAGFEAFSAIASEYREEWIVVKHTHDAAIMAALKCQDGDMFLVHDVNFRSKFEPDRIVVTSSGDISSNKAALLGAIQKETRGWVYKPMGKPMVVITGSIDFSHKYIKASQLVRNKVLPVAEKYREYTFALMNEDDFKDDMKTYGLDDTAEDNAIVILDGKKIYKYECEDGLSEKVVENVIKKFQKGTLERHIKSAKAPKKNNGPVKVVVANSFDKVVMSKKSDVLVEFYAPWCGHCKNLEPIFKKLGKKVSDQKDLVIAKFDAIANDIPIDDFDVTGFPTLYWVTKENRIEKYEGGRELKDFVEFIAKKRPAGVKDEL